MNQVALVHNSLSRGHHHQWSSMCMHNKADLCIKKPSTINKHGLNELSNPISYEKGMSFLMQAIILVYSCLIFTTTSHQMMSADPSPVGLEVDAKPLQSHLLRWWHTTKVSRHLMIWMPLSVECQRNWRSISHLSNSDSNYTKHHNYNRWTRIITDLYKILEW